MASQSGVQPHPTSVVVWDIPSAVVAGERFRMKVGIKCSHGSDGSPGSHDSDDCRLTGGDFRIYDHQGAQVAAGKLSGDRWPGTTGLYVAEAEMEAPAAEGLYTWSVKGPQGEGSDAGVSHAESSVGFGVRVVARPDYLVAVEAVDKVSHKPIPGAHVVMHPYRAVTDERGIAEVRVAKGAYKLFVSQTRYLTFGLPVEVTVDMTARAELDLEPERERN